MVNADLVGNSALRKRDQGSANDRHDHDSGAISRQRAKFRYTQSEDAGEHDGIE